MQISKKSQYGLRAMICLARVYRGERICPLREIAESEDIPFEFLEKIMGELEKAGLVRARKGPRGGYFLAREPEKVSVREIVETLEKTIVPVTCTGCIRARECLARGAWEEAEDSLVSTLDSITLAGIIRGDKEE